MFNIEQINIKKIAFKLSLTLLATALIIVGSLIAIPLGEISPIPLTLQSLFVVIASLLLGPQYGTLAVIIYLTLGGLGVPVFAGGTAGLAVLKGATSGYLWGFIPCVMASSMARGTPIKPTMAIFKICMFGYFILLLLGSVVFCSFTELPLAEALASSFTPFIPSMLISCGIATACYKFVASHELLKWCLD